MRPRITRFASGNRVCANQRSPYRHVPAGALGVVVDVGREVVFVDFPYAARASMDPYELDTAPP